jgi:transcriptional regulator with XRE-family HTH domain
VPADPTARMAAFTAFVRRALDHARTQRNLSGEDVAERAGISANTIYLWRSGKGTKFPLGVNVEAFCDALGVSPTVAFQILWPGKDEQPSEPIPLGPDEDLITLARKLQDPNTPPQELFLIRETIRGLAQRTNEPGETRKRRETG